MPCRVGITIDPAARRAYWGNRVKGLEGWRIIGTHPTRVAAQDQQTAYAANYGCVSSPGGAPVKGPWYVYRFDYTRDRR